MIRQPLLRFRILLEFASTIHTGMEEKNQAQKYRKLLGSHKLWIFVTCDLDLFSLHIIRQTNLYNTNNKRIFFD